MTTTKTTARDRKTTISFDEADIMLTVHTFNPKLINTLDKAVEERPELFKLIRIDDFGTCIAKTYEFPKRYLNVKVPKRLTEEQKKLLKARFNGEQKPKKDPKVHYANAEVLSSSTTQVPF